MRLLARAGEYHVGGECPTVVGGYYFFYPVETFGILGPGDDAFSEDEVHAELGEVVDDWE